MFDCQSGWLEGQWDLFTASPQHSLVYLHPPLQFRGHLPTRLRGVTFPWQHGCRRSVVKVSQVKMGEKKVWGILKNSDFSEFHSAWVWTFGGQIQKILLLHRLRV